jgi:hypothetical protein
MRVLKLAGFLLLCSAPFASAADEIPDVAPLMAKGRVEFAAGGGYGADDNRDYLILALGAGYYLQDGLSAGLSGEAWLGSKPQIYDVSPQARCVFLDSSWRYKPYVGAFYRRTFYSSRFSSLDSTGARAGLVFPLSPRAYLTGGAAYEHYYGCSIDDHGHCDLLYPELTLAFAF